MSSNHAISLKARLAVDVASASRGMVDPLFIPPTPLHIGVPRPFQKYAAVVTSTDRLSVGPARMAADRTESSGSQAAPKGRGGVGAPGASKASQTPKLGEEMPLRRLRRPPRVWRVPYVGLLYTLATTPKAQEVGPRLYEKHGPVFISDSLGRPTVNVGSAELINEVLDNPDVYQAQDAFPSLSLLLGDQVPNTTDGEKHAEARRRLAPLFSPQLLPFVSSIIDELVGKFWSSVCGKLCSSPAVAPIRLDTLFRSELTPAIALRIFAGIESPQASKDMLTFSLGVISPRLPIGPWAASHRARGRLEATFRALTLECLATRSRVIQRLRAMPTPAVVVRELAAGEADLFTVLVASTDPSANADAAAQWVSNQMIALLFAASVSTANALSSAVFELSRDANLQRTLRSEVDAGGATPMLDGFVREVLRLFPPVPGFFRRVCDDGAVLGGQFELQPGQMVLVDFAAAMRNPSSFEDPSRLDIHRGRTADWMPFGGGAHRW